MLRRLQLLEDLDLSKEMILDVSGRISFQGSCSCLRAVSTRCSSNYFWRGKYLEKLTFSEVLCFKLIYPRLGNDSWRREFFVDFFDVNV